MAIDKNRLAEGPMHTHARSTNNGGFAPSSPIEFRLNLLGTWKPFFQHGGGATLLRGSDRHSSFPFER
eukprot:5191-Prymnesium_polylepis.1